jgi:hypothetical protein
MNRFVPMGGKLANKKSIVYVPYHLLLPIPLLVLSIRNFSNIPICIRISCFDC